MRTVIMIAVLLLTMLSSSEARTRVPVWSNGPQRTNAEIICPWVTMSVPPGTPPGHYTLGVCPPQGMPK